MINIIVPIASRKFIDEGDNFQFPLPLVEIKGKSLIEYFLESLSSLNEEAIFTFVLNEEDCQKYHFDNTLKLLKPNSKIIVIKGKTQGAICSILMSIDEVNLESEVLILNYDQIINENLHEKIQHFRNLNADAGILTFTSVHPRWSYAKCYNNLVVQTAEKNPISNSAIAGFYYFKKFKYFTESSFDVIKFDDNYENNYYTSSIFNQLVLKNYKILNLVIENKKYHSFYSAQKVREFEDYLKLK